LFKPGNEAAQGHLGLPGPVRWGWRVSTVGIIASRVLLVGVIARIRGLLLVVARIGRLLAIAGIGLLIIGRVWLLLTGCLWISRCGWILGILLVLIVAWVGRLLCRWWCRGGCDERGVAVVAILAARLIACVTLRTIDDQRAAAVGTYPGASQVGRSAFGAGGGAGLLHDYTRG